METDKIRVGITHGDTNGVGYELILKAFADQSMCDMCVPVIYGSKAVAIYHRKAIGSETNFTVVETVGQAAEGTLNMVSCCKGEIPVVLGKATPDSGKAAREALQCALQDWKEGKIDVLVTCPIGKGNVYGDGFPYVGHTDFLEKEAGDGSEALMILMNSHVKVALATTHLPVKDVSAALTEDLLLGKLRTLDRSLKVDFGISLPRIAVFSLNPHNGEDGLLGKEEQEVISPAIQKAKDEGILCFGPYPADGFFGARLYRHFDAVLAMYHDQGLAPLKALSMSDGVNYTAGLPIVRTSPDHGTAFDIAGKGVADENSLRQAIYTAIDIWKKRLNEEKISANPLKIVPQERDSKSYMQRQGGGQAKPRIE